MAKKRKWRFVITRINDARDWDTKTGIRRVINHLEKFGAALDASDQQTLLGGSVGTCVEGTTQTECSLSAISQVTSPAIVVEFFHTVQRHPNQI